MLEPYLSPGDGVLDIGAHVGRYTQAYAKVVGPTGYVLAVEPDLISYETLRAVTRELPQVKAYHMAATGQGGKAVLHVDKEDRRRNSFWSSNRLAEGYAVAVNCVTVDTITFGVANLRGIKIDAQGAEAHILDGATETLKRNDLVWAVELWPEGLRNAGRSVREVADIFSAAGYHPVASHGRTWDQLVTLIEPYTGHKSTDVVLTHRES
jgi:FkbM family methyltransferase